MTVGAGGRAVSKSRAAAPGGDSSGGNGAGAGQRCDGPGSADTCMLYRAGRRRARQGRGRTGLNGVTKQTKPRRSVE